VKAQPPHYMLGNIEKPLSAGSAATALTEPTR
jgi:hypothetical protein